MLALAAHWLADEGRQVPGSYREVFLALADRSILERGLAERLATAAGLGNLIAHLDWKRVYTLAASGLDDLLRFCETLARRADAP